MKKSLIILTFLIVGLAFCQAQDKYLQVTSDSSLAFKLAMSDFPVTALPVGSAYNPCDIPVIVGGVGMGVGGGLLIAGIRSVTGAGHGVSAEIGFIAVGGVLLIAGTVALLSGLTCYLIRKHKHRTN